MSSHLLHSKNINLSLVFRIIIAVFVFFGLGIFEPYVAVAAPSSKKSKTKIAVKYHPKSTKKVSPAAKSSANSSEENGQPEQETQQACRSYILMDARTGDILLEQNAHQAFPPASMIKMLTAYVVLKKVEEGSVKLSDIVTTSAKASKIGGSQVYLKEGEQFSIAQLLEAIMVQSANDAATALAEHIGGDVTGFIQMMRDEAAALSLTETEINNVHGLPPSKGESTDLSSAHNLAIIGKTLITRFPEILELSSKTTAPFREGALTMTSSNHLLRTYPGADGIKTGYTVAAGFGVTATAQRNGVRMIATVMGCGNGKLRFSETARLLSLGFAQYRSVKLIDQGVAAKTPIHIIDGEKTETIVATSQPLTVNTRISSTQDVLQREEPCKELRAPVAKGTSCGAIIFTVDGKDIGKVSLVTTEAIPALGRMGKILRTVKLK